MRLNSAKLFDSYALNKLYYSNEIKNEIISHFYHSYDEPLPLTGQIQQTTNRWCFHYFFLENRSWHFMQIVSIGDNLQGM